MATKKAKPVTQRIAGPIDMDGARFPLSRGQSLDYVHAVHRLVFGDDSFFVVLYGALNVGGLIGTEYNGIAVLWENRGKVVLREHYRDSPCTTACAAQRREYARICAMDEAQFRAFVNDHPAAQHKVLVPGPRPIVRPKLGYRAGDFGPTRFATSEDKLKFRNALIRFLCNHCDRDRFTRRIYDGLYLHLGHIAHYNMAGFYAEWFEDPAARVRFLEHHAQQPVWGDWRDVDLSLKQWISGPEGQAVLERYRKEATHG
jgi:hypothetical protein